MYHNVAVYFIQLFISKSYHFIYYKYLFIFKFSHSFKTFLYFYHSYTGANKYLLLFKVLPMQYQLVQLPLKQTKTFPWALIEKMSLAKHIPGKNIKHMDNDNLLKSKIRIFITINHMLIKLIGRVYNFHIVSAPIERRLTIYV